MGLLSNRGKGSSPPKKGKKGEPASPAVTAGMPGIPEKQVETPPPAKATPPPEPPQVAAAEPEPKAQAAAADPPAPKTDAAADAAAKEVAAVKLQAMKRGKLAQNKQEREKNSKVPKKDKSAPPMGPTDKLRAMFEGPIRAILRCGCLQPVIDPAALRDLKKLFDALDQDHNGRVSSTEWGDGISQNKQLLRKYFGGDALDEFSRSFDAIDANKDGALSWAEFEAGAKRSLVARREMSSRELRAIFDSMDSDGDGRITGAEWGKGVSKNNVMLFKHFGGNSLKEIGSQFKLIDTDGNGSLSWWEFEAAAFKHVKEEQTDDAFAKVFVKAAIERGVVLATPK